MPMKEFVRDMKENTNMVIIFNGDTEDLLKRLQQYSDKDQKITLDFMMRNFKIMEDDGKQKVTRDDILYGHPDSFYTGKSEDKDNADNKA